MIFYHFCIYCGILTCWVADTNSFDVRAPSIHLNPGTIANARIPEDKRKIGDPGPDLLPEPELNLSDAASLDHHVVRPRWRTRIPQMSYISTSSAKQSYFGFVDGVLTEYRPLHVGVLRSTRMHALHFRVFCFQGSSPCLGMLSLRPADPYTNVNFSKQPIALTEPWNRVGTVLLGTWTPIADQLFRLIISDPYGATTRYLDTS